MSQNWYSPRDIYYSREQVLWLIPQIEILEDGLYPPEHIETGYGDGGSGGFSNLANYETAIMIVAELTIRLDATGTDGVNLVKEVNAEELYLSYRAKNALRYITGSKRKLMRYGDWLKQVKYRKKGGKYNGMRP